MWNGFQYTPNEKTRQGRTLILDLDETLACSQQNFRPELFGIYSDPQIYRRFHPVGQKQICYSVVIEQSGLRIWGVTRPGLEEFIRFAQRYFENVIIWSAGINCYVEGICKEIFDGIDMKMPRIIWSRDKCSSEANIFHKPIASLISAVEDKTHLNIDLRKTLILDDREHTFLKNPQNGVLIPAFKPTCNVMDLTNRSDSCLYKFMSWLVRPEIDNAEDYRTLDKTRIFV